MFVGHYSASLVAKAVDKRLPLGALFLAAQLVDIFWALLVLAGVERIRIVPGITAANPLDLIYIPYTHSLLAAVLWGVAATALYRLFGGSLVSLRSALIVGAVVLSHWFLDLLMHRPDLPLIGDAHKVGLGLWNHLFASLAVEIALLFGALALYLRATSPTRASGRWAGRWAVPLFCAIMALLLVISTYAPAPPSSTAVALSALIVYLLFAWIARRLDRLRE